jgi:hypothetical protein
MQNWHWDALYCQLLLVLLLASFHQCSIFVVVIQTLVSDCMRTNTENLPKRTSSDRRTKMYCHMFEVSEGTRVQVLGTLWLSLPGYVRLDVCSEGANGVGI